MTDAVEHNILALDIVSTLDDQVALAMHVGNRPPLIQMRRRFEAIMMISVPFIMLAAFMLAWALDTRRPALGDLFRNLWADRTLALTGIGGGFAVMGLCLLGSRLSRRWWIKLNLRRLLKARPDVDPNDPACAYLVQVTFDADGIALASATGSSRVNWTAIIRLDETPDYFILIGPSLIAISLAKRAMTPEQQIRFQALVAMYAPHAVPSTPTPNGPASR